MLAGCVVEPPPPPLVALPVASAPASTPYRTQQLATTRTHTSSNQPVATAHPTVVYPGYPYYAAYRYYAAYPFYGSYPYYAGYYPYPAFPGYARFGYVLP